MKKIYLIGILFLSMSELLACDCANIRFDEAFRRSSHVASGKVIEISSYEVDPNLLKVKFEVYEEFKGSDLNEFYIQDPQKADGMCHVYLKKGQELLVYLSSLDGGFPSYGYCSRNFSLNSLKSHPEEIEILRRVKEKGINYTSIFLLIIIKMNSSKVLPK